MTPNISIGLPFYNNESTLGDAIRSVFAQSCQDWELLLVDDGSTDASLSIARAVSDPRVKVFSDGVNKGLVARLNQIAALAQGRYMARMDGDDLMHPERLERQLAYLEAHPEVDLVDTAMYSMDNECQVEGVRGLAPLETNPEQVLHRGLLHHATVLGKTSWFKSHAYDPRFVRAEDVELWCRTCTGSRFARLPEPLYFVREGRINVRGYLTAMKTLRLIYRIYGPRYTSYSRTLSLMLGTYAKSVAYRLFSAAQKNELLVRQRNASLDAAERRQANRWVAQIRGTPLPGATD